MARAKHEIGSGDLIDPDVIELFVPRRCGRELVGAYTEGRTCSLGTLPFAAACRYHITNAEKDAALMASIAFRLGVTRGRMTSDGDPDYPERPEEFRKITRKRYTR